ncbi:MAG: hypothetical protein RI885_1650 [Actinomycetota bacterium]|jgi:hypothetical membrane protein
MSPADRPSAERRRLIPGVVLLFGFVYIVFEFIAASAWVAPPYDWARDFISDLGYSGCGAADGPAPCSPLHPLMNAGLMVQGTIFTVGSVMVTRLVVVGAGWRIAVGSFLVVSGVGTFFVGVFHLSPELTASGFGWLHFLSATLAIGPGNAGILLLGLRAIPRPAWRGYGIAIVVLGAFGLVAGVVLLTPSADALGLGLVERLSVYPLNVWTIGTGVGLLVASARWSIRARRSMRARMSATAG